VDMLRHLRRFLNDTTLRELGDVYEGRIEAVAEELIRNRHNGTKTLEPVIAFEDGWRLIPNIGQRKALIEMFGPDTDMWIGRSLQVFRARLERIDSKTGLVKVTFEKRVAQPKQFNDAQAFERRLRARTGTGTE
jgi:hypothetical protein